MNEAHQEEQSLFEQQHKVVQKNIPYYDLKWKSVENPATKSTWNWLAFFFSTFWLAYRKMYKPFFIIAGLQLVWSVPFYFIDLSIWLDLPFYGIISIIVGLFGNRCYFNHTNHVLKQARVLPENVQESYIQTKGGTHIGSMIGLHVLLIALFFALDFGLSFIPTETNIKNAVRISEEADTLEAYMDNPKWNYIKQDGRHHVVEFTGYDYTEKEDVRIVFYVYFDKYMYEWNQVYINGKKLNEDDSIDYELYIEESSW